MPRVELKERRIVVDGHPRLLLAGEVHYFRLSPVDWEDRLRRLRDCGADTVATYVPWLWHELPDGGVDLHGRTHPQRDLAGYPRPRAPARPAGDRAARPVHHGRGQERGHPVPGVRRRARGAADHLGRRPGRHPDHRLPRAGVHRGRGGLVRRGDAGDRRPPRRPGRPGGGRAAGQRDRHAVVGHQLPRPHRPGLRRPRPVGGRGARGRRRRRAVRRRPVRRRRLGGRRAPAGRGPRAVRTPGSGHLHARPLPSLRRGTARERGTPRRDRRPVRREHPRHRRRARADVPDRHLASSSSPTATSRA